MTVNALSRSLSLCLFISVHVIGITYSDLTLVPRRFFHEKQEMAESELKILYAKV